MLNGDEDLWCNILRSKYQVGNNTDSLNAKHSDSILWKDIMKTSTQLKDMGIWRIGDSSSTNPWNQCWIENGLIIANSVMCIPSNLVNITVKDLTDVARNWNWSILRWLPSNIQLKIAAVLPPMQDNRKDMFVTAMDEEKNLSVSRMYKFLNDSADNTACKDWHQIWKLQVLKELGLLCGS